jgi:hypothetical protein
MIATTPDPLQFTLQDWIDQEREQKSEVKNDLLI